MGRFVEIIMNSFRWLKRTMTAFLRLTMKFILAIIILFFISKFMVFLYYEITGNQRTATKRINGDVFVVPIEYIIRDELRSLWSGRFGMLYIAVEWPSFLPLFRDNYYHILGENAITITIYAKPEHFNTKFQRLEEFVSNNKADSVDSVGEFFDAERFYRVRSDYVIYKINDDHDGYFVIECRRVPEKYEKIQTPNPQCEGVIRFSATNQLLYHYSVKYIKYSKLIRKKALSIAQGMKQS